MCDSNAGFHFAATGPDEGDEHNESTSLAVVADFDVEEEEDVSHQHRGDRRTVRSEKKLCLATTEENDDGQHSEMVDDSDNGKPQQIGHHSRFSMVGGHRAVACIVLSLLLLLCSVVVFLLNQSRSRTNDKIDHRKRQTRFAPDFRKMMGVAHDMPVNLSWHLRDGNFTFELELSDGGGGIGWLGFGIADPYARTMAGADMAIVEGLGGPSSSWQPVTITDMFTKLSDQHRRHEPPTTDLETVQNWHLLAVERHASSLRVRITRSRTEGLDVVADRPLPYDDNVDTTFLLAFGPDSQMPRHRGHRPTDRLRFSVSLETGVDDADRMAAIKNRPGVKKTTLTFPLVGNVSDWHLYVPLSRQAVVSELHRQLNLSEGSSSMPLPVVLFVVAQAPPNHHVQLLSCKRSGNAFCPYDYYIASVAVTVENEGYVIEDGSAALIGKWEGDTFECGFHGKVNGPISSEVRLELWIDTVLNDRLLLLADAQQGQQRQKGEQEGGAAMENDGSSNIFHASESVRLPKYPGSVDSADDDEGKKKNTSLSSQPAVLTSFTSSECTHKVMLRPVYIHSVHPHMHDTGLRFAFSFRNRTGHEYAAVESTAHDYTSEFWRQLRRPIQLSPGDQFVIQCVFYPKTNDVVLQAGPLAEMCTLALRTSPRSAWAPGGNKLAPFDFLCKENTTVLPLSEAKRQGMMLNYTGWQP